MIQTLLSVGSTGFQLIRSGVNDGRTYYFEDDTLGNIFLYYLDSTNTKIIVNKSFGTVDYENGEIMIGYSTPVTFVATDITNSVISSSCFAVWTRRSGKTICIFGFRY